MDHRTKDAQQDAIRDAEKNAEQIADQVWAEIRPNVVSLIAGLLGGPLSPTAFYQFEMSLAARLMSLGRRVLELTANRIEPDQPECLCLDLWFDGDGYGRREEKSRRQQVATLFGSITLWRRGYRNWGRLERSIFPLELMLGLVEGATPALGDRLGQWMAESGATQGRVLERLRRNHGVSMGAERLRKITDQLSISMGEFRQECQVDYLIECMNTALVSQGPRKPVLAVGRDGVTLRDYRYRFWEVATAATITVYDRAGKRVGTAYLAYPPELGQSTMSNMMTELLLEVLKGWEGPLPRLAYISDCGENESGYYNKVLRYLRHPRSGKRLKWQRVVDYYHVTERITTMAESLFKKDSREGKAWMRRMRKALKKRSGTSRVLHSAAILKNRRTMSKTKREEFDKAYRYIQRRTRYMRYAEYAGMNIPIGSGVTEAACKTIFGQRMKLSGMRWTKPGALSILTLRTVLLSTTWNATYAKHLEALDPVTMRPYGVDTQTPCKIAA